MSKLLVYFYCLRENIYTVSRIARPRRASTSQFILLHMFCIIRRFLPRSITTQKMKRKKKRKPRRGKRTSVAVQRSLTPESTSSFDALGLEGELGLEDELMMPNRSGDLAAAPVEVVHSEPPTTVEDSPGGGGGNTWGGGARRSRRRSSVHRWETRGKTSETDRAAWKRASASSDDILALVNMCELDQDETLRSTSSYDGSEQVNHDEEMIQPVTDIV